MLYRVPGDRKTGYDLGVGMGTYGARTVGAMRVRCGYGTVTGRGYGLKTGTVGKLYQYAVPTGHTHVPYPYRIPVPKSTHNSLF